MHEDQDIYNDELDDDYERILDESPLNNRIDLPVITPEQIRAIRFAANAVRKAKAEKQTKVVVSIRLSPETYKKVRGLGKGYSSVISRMIEKCINDPDLLRDCL